MDKQYLEVTQEEVLQALQSKRQAIDLIKMIAEFIELELYFQCDSCDEYHPLEELQLNVTERS